MEMEAFYGGIDLHSNNSVVVVKDADGKVVCRRRVVNELRYIEPILAPYRHALRGVIVESTFNWYWLVDGLMAAGYPVKLANTTATEQYSGLKHTDDDSDAEWLAEMDRLGILPTGYIYPREQRAVRDLLRKRAHLVRQRTANILSIGNLLQRNSGTRLTSDAIKALDVAHAEQLYANQDLTLAIASTVRVRQCLDQEIKGLEKAVRDRVKLRPQFAVLHTIPGVGDILALTMMLETGEVRRFATVGDFASYGRCVNSTKLSNFKKKGKGNVRNGNKYLAWAFVEAANFAIRFSVPIQRFYQRKKRRTNGIVAIKAVAHKLARAAYYMLRDGVPFDVSKAFS
jgi:transposase